MSEAKFNKAVEIVQNLPKDGPIKPSQDQQLEFYKNYKQATNGDVVDGTRPGLLDFVGKAKWDAWASVKGRSKEEAQKAYYEALLKILKESDTEEGKKYVAELESA